MLFLGGSDDIEVCTHTPYVALYSLTNLKLMRGFAYVDHEFRVPKQV
jgi:hypothetical protein